MGKCQTDPGELLIAAASILNVGNIKARLPVSMFAGMMLSWL